MNQVSKVQVKVNCMSTYNKMYEYTVAYAMEWTSTGLADGQIWYSAFFWLSVYVYLIAEKINVLNNAPLWPLTQHVICKVLVTKVIK